MSDIQKQAYQDYLDGLKYFDVAAKYDIPLNTVKSWAVRHWNKEKVAPVAAGEEKLQPQPRTKGGANNIRHGAQFATLAKLYSPRSIYIP